jgi:hypothetical protein
MKKHLKLRRSIMQNDNTRFHIFLIVAVIIGAIIGAGFSSIPLIIGFIVGMMLPIDKVADYLSKTS